MADQDTHMASSMVDKILPRFFIAKLLGVMLTVAAILIGGVWYIVDTSLRGFEAAVSTQNERIGAVEASVLEGRSELNGRFDSQTSTIEARFNSLDEQFSALDARIDNILNQNSRVLSEVAVLAEKVSSLTDAVRESGYEVPVVPQNRQSFNGLLFAYVPFDSEGIGVETIQPTKANGLQQKSAGKLPEVTWYWNNTEVWPSENDGSKSPNGGVVASTEDWSHLLELVRTIAVSPTGNVAMVKWSDLQEAGGIETDFLDGESLGIPNPRKGEIYIPFRKSEQSSGAFSPISIKDVTECREALGSFEELLADEICGTLTNLNVATRVHSVGTNQPLSECTAGHLAFGLPCIRQREMP